MFKGFTSKNTLHTLRAFNKHSKVIVVGAGTGGISVANQLVNEKVYNYDDITIFDPAKYHYYQPGYTKVGGGAIESNYLIDNFIRYDMNSITNKFNFQNTAVESFDLDNNSIVSANDTWTYDQLIIGTGIQVDIDKIKGIYHLK